MQFGVQLHPEAGADAVIREAQQADTLGYDSVWLYDHLMNWAGVQTADFPLDTLTLAAAVGAATRRVRISWAVLNLGFYNPALLAKALATIDQITHGRVICTAGSGWFKEECEAYHVPMIQDHDERSAAAYEAVRSSRSCGPSGAGNDNVRREVLPHHEPPVPAAPYRPLGPPSGLAESEATQRIVKDHASGWVLLRARVRAGAAGDVGAGLAAAADDDRQDLPRDGRRDSRTHCRRPSDVSGAAQSA